MVGIRQVPISQCIMGNDHMAIPSPELNDRQTLVKTLLPVRVVIKSKDCFKSLRFSCVSVCVCVVYVVRG